MSSTDTAKRFIYFEREWDVSTERGQKGLANAHEHQERVLCPCKSKDRAELYVAKIGDKYWPKRMPNTGDAHDGDCPLYEVNPLLSGRNQLDSRTLSKEPDGTKIKVAFALTGRIGSNGSQSSALPTPETDVIKHSTPGLSLLGVLHLLWDSAQLNRFWPAMRNKRFYGVVERELRKAAGEISSSRHALVENLLIPQYFKSDEVWRNTNAAAAFVDKLAPKGRTFGRGVVIGELEEFDHKSTEQKIILKYLPVGLRLHERAMKKVGERYGYLDPNTGKVMVIALVRNELNDLMVEQIALMGVDQNYIPIGPTGRQQMLINLLNDTDRGYSFVFDFDTGAEAISADMVLLDTDKPTPVFIEPTLPPGATEEEKVKHNLHIDRLNTICEKDFPHAVRWGASDELKLPPPRKRKARVEHPDLSHRDSGSQSTHVEGGVAHA